MIFKKLFSKKARKRLRDSAWYYAVREAEIQSLTTENLITTAKYYLSQMQAPTKYAPDAPIYDSIFYYIIIPEILDRLDEKATESMSHNHKRKIVG